MTAHLVTSHWSTTYDKQEGSQARRLWRACQPVSKSNQSTKQGDKDEERNRSIRNYQEHQDIY